MKFVPLEKRSKREQQAYHASRRGSWGGVNPVTKMSPNPKAYNRKKSGRRSESPPGFFSLTYIVISSVNNSAALVCLSNIHTHTNKKEEHNAKKLRRKKPARDGVQESPRKES
ncbi:MAG: hypothetical protein LBR76_03790 [Oscillospiraceae bacterium]|nr:hypothetical protein [Oscillospiraceae bacterium]